MGQIYNVRNGGNGAITLGMKKVNSYNVAPVTVTATAAGTTIPISTWLNFDYINATQTSAATDAIYLPAAGVANAQNQFFPAGAVGAEYRVFAVTAMKVLPPVDGASTINAGTNVQGISIAAGNLAIFQCTKTSGAGLVWVCTNIAPAGTLTAPVPA